MNRHDTDDASQGNFYTYIAGYVLSLDLTGTAFWLVHRHLQTNHLSPSDDFMLVGLAVLAITQLFVQLIFFLHLDRESKPRWNSVVLGFAVIVVVILVGGSIWIMTTLNYHHVNGGHNHYLTPAQLNKSIIQDEGVQP